MDANNIYKLSTVFCRLAQEPIKLILRKADVFNAFFTHFGKKYLFLEQTYEIDDDFKQRDRPNENENVNIWGPTITFQFQGVIDDGIKNSMISTLTLALKNYVESVAVDGLGWNNSSLHQVTLYCKADVQAS